MRHGSRARSSETGNSPISLVVLLAVLAAMLVALFHRPPGSGLALESGEVLPKPRSLPEFQLADQHGRPFTRAGLRGHWTLLFAGFTHCPDICPTTLATLATLDSRLAGDGNRLRTVFLSLDPERDDPATLARYLEHFNADFVGLTGEQAEIDQLMAGLGLVYIKVPMAGDEYSIDHSAALALIDPYGRVAAYFKPPFSPDRLAADLAPLPGIRP